MTHIPVLITYTNEAGESIEDNFANLTMASRSVGVSVETLAKALDGKKIKKLSEDFSIEKIDYDLCKCDMAWASRYEHTLTNQHLAFQKGYSPMEIVHCDVCNADVKKMSIARHNVAKAHLLSVKKCEDIKSPTH